VALAGMRASTVGESLFTRLQAVLAAKQPSLRALCAAIATAVAGRRRGAGADGLRVLADAAAEGLVFCENGLIRDANAAFIAVLGLPREQVQGRPLVALLAPECRDQLDRISAEPREMQLIAADGATVPVAIAARSQDAGRRVYAVEDIRDRQNVEARIHYLAHHDALTGLANRVTLNERLAERLERAWLEDEQFAVLCLDLDRFKEVNDVFGHAAGDEVLVEATRRMRAVARPDDIVARLGGDEFAMVCARSDPRQAGDLAERLIATMLQDFSIGDQKASIGVSVGIAMFPSHGATPEALLAHADVALYRAKAQGRGSYCFYNSHMDTLIRERRALANDLTQAQQRGELQLHFQPQARVATLDVTAFEVLVRWCHPEHGYVPPDRFIALAEENGMVNDLGLWVMREACATAAGWRNPLDIAVNISPLQFQQGDLPEQILTILVETGLPPSRLELEITETALIKDFDRALSMLRRLKALGLRIAMDDFGTGWSSLSTLQAFPFDRLKIDRTFIDKLGRYREADVIVRAVLGLGRNLAIPVLAEGVETEAQWEFLYREGCDDLQGYLLSRPGPIASFAELVDLQEIPLVPVAAGRELKEIYKAAG
jgi:diguanylate cyclase (GGDEF)-like protein/PAS domain S-box-containing protein